MISAGIRSEVFKLTRQSRTWYAVGALLLIQLVVIANAWYQGEAILNLLLENLKKTFVFEGELLNGHLLVYLILNTMWFHLPLILMIVVSAMLTTEYDTGSLRTVLMTGVDKRSFMGSKFIVAIGFTIVMVWLVAITSALFSYLIFGTGDLFVYFDSLNFYSSREAFERLTWAFVAGTFSMVFFSVASLFIAIILRETIKTWIVAALLLVLCNLMLQMEIGPEWWNRLFFVNLLDVWQLFFSYQIDHAAIAQHLGILTLYIIMMVAGGIYLFKKQETA